MANNTKEQKVEKVEEAKAPEVKAEKSKYTPPTVGVSSQGAAVFVKGHHPKARQIADKLTPPTEVEAE